MPVTEPTQFDLLLTGGKTLTDDLDGLRPVCVGITDGKVTHVGGELPAHTANEVLDAGDAVVLPGFVSAHTHVAQGFGKGVFDGLHLTEWLVTLRRSYATLTDEQVYTASLLGALESIKSGVTFINDMATAGERYDVVAQAIADSGIRAHVGSAFLDRREGHSPVPSQKTDEVLAAMQRFHARWDGAADGRIRAAITPVGLPSCSEALMRGSADLARDLNAPLHTHCAEEHLATEESRTRFGASEVQVLDRLGLLGERTTLAHTIWVDDADIATIAGRRSLVSHCPSTNMKITDGIAPVEAMRRAGVKLALGTDGAASSGGYDILQETRLAAMLAKVATMDSQALPNAALWSMLIDAGGHFGVRATRAPWPLQTGMAADLTLIRYPQLHLVDDRRFLSNLVFSATAGDVRDVLVGGRIVLRDGALTHHDEARLLVRVREAMASLAPLPTSSEELPS